MSRKTLLKALFLLVVFIFALNFGMVGNAVSGEITDVGSINAVVTDQRPYIGYPRVGEGEPRGRSHFPDHPETYIPMPLPERREPISKEPKSIDVIRRQNRPHSYNLITGEEVIYEPEIIQKDIPIGAVVDGGRGAGLRGGTDEDQRIPMNFSDLILVDYPENYPMNVIVKIYFTKGTGNFQCSGTLIDPMHVLTAGHCVHEGNGGNWATNVVVVPGYQNGVRPYGDASGVELHSWTGWTQDADWDHDMGVIDLDRPVGALTGWHGYGYNDDCFFFTWFNTFWNPGYPGDSPYNGEYMYYWYGTFDGCETILGIWYGNEVSINKRCYHGQSGSGAYTYDSAYNRIVYAVLSNSVDLGFLGTTTYDVRITSDKFEHIRDGIIGYDTPSTFDLIPLDVTTSPAAIPAGTPLAWMSYLVHNYSSASWSGTVNADVYLSTDDIITSSDTLIQSHSFSLNLGPKSASRVWVETSPTIPINTPAGLYFIGVILNVSDQNVGNNYSNGQEASRIMVGAKVDFNGDGKTDILWRNKTTGQNVAWLMNGYFLSSYSWIETVADTNWEIVGTGDFNGVGKTDILWRNKITGENIIWFMNGAVRSTYSYIETVADTNWEVVGTGDFNRDGKTDILWRNKSTGENIIWFMNGAVRSSYSSIGALADTNWQIVGTGDFDRDGKVDILWRNKSTGENAVWFMNGSTYRSSAGLEQVADTNWQIVGTGDFNRDGKTDILWRNKSTGENIIWFMNGTVRSSYSYIDAVADTNWDIVGLR